MKEFRKESDSMGSLEIPVNKYWGAQTERARLNFNVSPHRIPQAFLKALGIVKKASLRANVELGLIDSEIATHIDKAALEVIEGSLSSHFPVDVFQTGSGTSWNMNANEVISGRANELINGVIGGREPVHPNDHVNRGQSSNCVIPSALNVSCRLLLQSLVDALGGLKAAFSIKSNEFEDIIKIGRTHLQDAVPMTLGQEFSSFHRQIEKSIERIKKTYSSLEELPLGGTAIGTGLNAHKDFSEKAVSEIARITGIPFVPAVNAFEGIAARDAQMELFGALNSLAVSLMKIAQDLRLLSSGPRTGLGEIILPSLQPGSSVMPGKVNPVIPEMVIQACAHVMGKHLSATVACQNSPLQLNIMMPLLAHESLSAIELLTGVAQALGDRCVNGIQANKENCRQQVEWSLAMVTPLALKIGYDKAAELAYKAYKESKTVRELVLSEGLLSADEANAVLDPAGMIGPKA